MYILNMFVSLNLRETNISFFRIEKNDLESAVDLLKSWQISRELINHWWTNLDGEQRSKGSIESVGHSCAHNKFWNSLLLTAKN